MKNKIFLLGGYDLEMLEIKKILDSNNIQYIDKELSWGAKLSEYKDELSFDGIIYGIEIEADITPPDNYVEIDHHNENSNNPSSIEQVAKILDIHLSREQLLVSKNDSDYIEGMKSISATQKEIDEISASDRKAQGITKDDEKLASLSIIESDSNIIYSKTLHFTAVSDIAYSKYNNYIIYNDTKVVFYGYEIKNIKDFLIQHNIQKDSYYYGGGDFGFLGIKENRLKKDEIKDLIKEFEKLKEDKEKIYSYHTFMLPFTYGISNKKKIIKDWEKTKYDVGYNQQSYFHKFFKDSMYSNNIEIYNKESFKNSTITMKKSKNYTLTLKDVTLRLFDTDIGILTFNIENTNHYDAKSILEINDYLRRIYPEYLDHKYKVSGLVPEYVTLGDKTEYFKYDKNLKKPKLSKIIEQFIPSKYIQPAVDDRMFTISFYNNPNLSNQLKENYIYNDTWYEYVFVDGNGKMVQDKVMQKELIQKATYTRWKDYGTMYGMSKYSFVCLANSDFPLEHMKSIYFDMFTLLLMVRATLLKFASEVSEIANNLEKNTTSNNVTKLYEEYIKFINKYYFREITAKDQGLELYEKSLEILSIQRDVKDLDNEIEELFKYVEMQQRKDTEIEAEKTNEKLNFLTMLGGVLIPASLITGLFGMNTIDKYTVGTVIVSIIGMFIYMKFKKENHE